MATTVTISSAGTSNTLILDFIGAKTTSLGAIFSSSTSSAAANIQITLDSSAQSGAAPTWFFASTATFTSSSNFDLPTFLQITTPIAGARLNSTGLSSGSITLRALQNAGG